MKEPLVSIVTPVHNTAPYLAECIQSVLRQRYANWQHVIVDNASTDGSLDIARRYASDDPRIRALRYDQLLAQVPNYNRALGQVDPDCKFVKFLEADNWLFPDCLEKMVELAQTHPSVGIVSSYNTTETRIRFTGLPLARCVVQGRETARMHLSGDAYLFGAPTTVLMRADVVRAVTPFYNESHLLGEDLSACFDALRTWDFGFVHQILTFVRTENESILSKIKGFDAQALDRVVLLRRHGRDFFSTQEYNRAEASLTRDYYASLARGAIKRQGSEFWQFHRAGLRSSELELDRFRLSCAVLRELGARALDPVGLLRRGARAGRT